jgi:cytochrome c553
VATRYWLFLIELGEHLDMTASLMSERMIAALFVLAALLKLHSAHAQDVSRVGTEVKQLVAACVACHPMGAISAQSVTPIIWGQNVGYVYLQLRDFKRATRASDSDAAMHALTQTMTDSQMLAIAEFVSAQPWPHSQDRKTASTDPLFLQGALIVAYGDCGGCHFNNLQGYSAAPRLRGQTSAYLTTTINEFRSGKRGNSPGMSDFLRVYSAEDIRAVIAYLSSVE